MNRGWMVGKRAHQLFKALDGVDEEAVEILVALLAVLGLLPSGPAFREQLIRMEPERRGRISCVAVHVNTANGVPEAKVAEDLEPLALPYSDDVLESRRMMQVADDWRPAPSPVGRHSLTMAQVYEEEEEPEEISPVPCVNMGNNGPAPVQPFGPIRRFSSAGTRAPVIIDPKMVSRGDARDFDIAEEKYYTPDPILNYFAGFLGPSP